MDSVALIWLSDAAKTGDAVKALEAIKEKGNIAEIYGAEKIMALFGDASKDSRVPNIVVIPKPGVIYAKPKAKKVGEHGGFGEDDSHVGLIVSMPSMAATTVADPVTNMQVAPTIVKALRLDPMSLQTVKAEGTKVLPGF